MLLIAGLSLVPDATFASTGRLLSQWMSRAPRIDGLIAAGEWSEATWVDMGAGVSLRVGNDARTLYLALLDSGDSVYGAGDALKLYFDDEGGVAPILDDGAWANSGCQQLPDLGEGQLTFAPNQSVVYVEFSQASPCNEEQFITDRTSFSASGRPEGVTYETAIPLDGPSPLRALRGERFGVSLLFVRDSLYVACLPACGFVDPASFRTLVLASGGCNTGPQGFGSGLPQVGLPLDWESAFFGVGQGWGQSSVFADPVFCQDNVTGGTGAAACVSEALQGGSETESLLSVPVSLSAQGTARMRLLAYFEEGELGAFLKFGFRRQDASFVFPVAWFENHGSESVEFDLPMPAGNLPVELVFDHFTLSAGAEGGFAEVDDVELLCGPVLFADGFDSGLTTHWSATTP